MRMDKVIVRAIVSTLLAICALVAFMILALAFIFPSTMMKITYDLGMDGASVRNAKRAYKYSGEVSYIAYATEVAIVDDDFEKIGECGKLFISDENFDKYCSERNQNLPEGVEGAYEQYVYGQVCVAEYKLGNKENAVTIAFSGVEESFPKNNAVIALLLTAVSAGDNDTKNTIYYEMSQKTLSTEEEAYFEEIVRIIGQTNG